MSNPLVGSTVIVRFTVTDPDTGERTDASVTADIMDPSGNHTTPTPDHPSTGVYDVAVALDEPGYFAVTLTATSGDLTTVEECSVCADASVVS